MSKILDVFWHERQDLVEQAFIAMFCVDCDEHAKCRHSDYTNLWSCAEVSQVSDGDIEEMKFWMEDERHYGLHRIRSSRR